MVGNTNAQSRSCLATFHSICKLSDQMAPCTWFKVRTIRFSMLNIPLSAIELSTATAATNLENILKSVDRLHSEHGFRSQS